MAKLVVILGFFGLFLQTVLSKQALPYELAKELAREIIAYKRVSQESTDSFDSRPLPRMEGESEPYPIPPIVRGGSLDPWIEEDDSMILLTSPMDGSEFRFREEDVYGSTDRDRFDPTNKQTDSVQCGMSENDRIVGGEEARLGEFPWMVALETSWGLQYCGGSLINQKYVLTAAHCVTWGRAVLKSRVLIGAYNLANQGENRVSRGIRKIKVHIKYNSSTTDYDVALIELDNPVDIGGNIKTLCLPDENLDLVGDNLFVAGWGRVSTSGSSSQILRDVIVQVISNDVCQYMYQPNVITPRMICAGNPKGGKDSCQGDSGGPLMKQESTKQWTQVGIVSFGIGCGDPKYPGVYTRLPVLVDWVRRHSNN